MATPRAKNTRLRTTERKPRSHAGLFFVTHADFCLAKFAEKSEIMLSLNYLKQIMHGFVAADGHTVDTETELIDAPDIMEGLTQLAQVKQGRALAGNSVSSDILVS